MYLFAYLFSQGLIFNQGELPIFEIEGNI